MSLTRGDIRSALHGTIAIGRIPSASSAARCSLRHSSERPCGAQAPQPPELGPKESASASTGAPLRSQTRLRIALTARPSERAP